MAENRLSIDWRMVKTWLQNKPEGIEVGKELQSITECGFELNPLSKVNVHMKLESLLKDEPITVLQQQKIRIIVWQMKGIAAIFSEIFKSAKTRLKSLMAYDVIYADGLTPQEINDKLSNIPVCKYFVDSDAHRQDRQTDNEIIECEMCMYDLLGVDKLVISMWRQIHKNWYLRGRHISGHNDAMRHSGQATTAIGNTIVNMLVNWRMSLDHKSTRKFVMMLGDDRNEGNDSQIDYVKYRKSIKDHYNMILDVTTHETHGVFCHFLTSIHDGRIVMSPDMIRLKNRYEVTNGVSLCTDDNIMSRRMSYCMNIGDTVEVQRVIKQYDLPIKPTIWYDFENSLVASSAYNECSVELVRDNYRQLISMLLSDKLYDVGKLITYSNKY
jgi:hypothetical protein